MKTCINSHLQADLTAFSPPVPPFFDVNMFDGAHENHNMHIMCKHVESFQLRTDENEVGSRESERMPSQVVCASPLFCE